MDAKTKYFKRIDEIRKGLREDERPSYSEITAWITSMEGQENLKATLRRVSCIARTKGISFKEVEQCVNYGFHTIGDPNSTLRKINKEILDQCDSPNLPE